MLLMTSSGLIDSLGDEICVLAKHKPKGCEPVNMLDRMLHCGISVPKPVDWQDLPIEQTL
jgi:hypothetical protein